MYYRCPECKKIYDSYIEKCTECGSKIELSDSVSEARVKDYEAEEDFEEKVKLLNRRVRNGYISIPICMILCGVLGFVVASFELSRIGIIVAFAVSFVVILISYALIIVKCHFWACPYCDTILSKRTSYMAYNCPQCGKRLRK